MKTYEKTHPWINFSIDLRPISSRLWIMLGECQSKCEHIANVPLKPATSKELHTVYLVKGVNATTAIEGNTLSEEQVRQHIDGQLSLPPSQQYQEKEIENIIRCCNKILDDIKRNQSLALSKDTICFFNKEILQDLPLQADVIPGEIRTHSVGVGRYRGAPAGDCDYLVNRYCDWLNGEDFIAKDSNKIVFAIVKAIVAHLYMAWIHPFGDGNGRTARLIELMILIDSGVPSASAHLLSNHYNKTRVEYIRQLDMTSQPGGDINSFINYAVQGFLDGLREQIDEIWKQQWKIAWENYVHEVLPDKRNSASQKRRLQLILDMTNHEKLLTKNEIRDISPQIAREYATKTGKTLNRDLNELMRLKLVEEKPGGFRALCETILKFLPPQKLK